LQSVIYEKAWLIDPAKTTIATIRIAMTDTDTTVR